MKADYGDFKESIKKNPFQGSDLGCGLRKIRIKITSKGKGKSGVITAKRKACGIKNEK